MSILDNKVRNAIPCTCIGDTFDPRCGYHSWEQTRARSQRFRPGLYPADMTKRERHARRLLDSALSTGAMVHYMGVYARSVPR